MQRSTTSWLAIAIAAALTLAACQRETQTTVAANEDTGGSAKGDFGRRRARRSKPR
jgi:hypothetical protein